MDVKLGQILAGNEQRDAIHIAIAPVQADEELQAGVHVGLSKETGKASTKAEHIGIVDPYLCCAVKRDEWFYLCLYPQTVTSLRHHWTHPAFGPEATAGMDDRAKSEVWLRCYAERKNCSDTPHEAFNRLITGLMTGDLYFRGSDLHSRYDLTDESELQFHAERYLGREINFDRFTFSCSC